MGERGGVRDLMRDSCRAVRRPSRCVYERTGRTAPRVTAARRAPAARAPAWPRRNPRRPAACSSV